MSEQSMTGPLTSGGASTFPRAFRFVLKSLKYPGIEYWVRSIKTDFINKKLDIQIYDDLKGCVYNWLNGTEWNEDTLTITHFDGCGNELYLLTFSGVELIANATVHDYDNSNILTYSVAVCFKKVDRKMA